MGRNRFDDKQMDELLSGAMSSSAQPSDATVSALKAKLTAANKRKGTLSLWWLPALSGTVVSVCALYALSFMANWKCMSAAMVLGALFSLSAWALSIIGACKFDFFKEASKLL